MISQLNAARAAARDRVDVNLVGAEIKHLSFDASEVLSTDSAAPTRIVKGVTGTTAARGFLTLQNNHATAVIYLIDKPGKPQVMAYALRPTDVVLLDVFTPSGELYAYSDTAGAQLTMLEGT